MEMDISLVGTALVAFAVGYLVAWLVGTSEPPTRGDMNAGYWE